MTLKQLEKRLATRRIVLTMNYLVRKKVFYVQATKWKTPAAKCEHPDLEVAIEAVLRVIDPFVPMTPEQKTERRANNRLLKVEDEMFGRRGR